jgi:hypothetical protein
MSPDEKTSKRTSITEDVVNAFPHWVAHGDVQKLTVIVTKYAAIHPRKVKQLIYCIKSIGIGLKWSEGLGRFRSKGQELNHERLAEFSSLGWEQYFIKREDEITDKKYKKAKGPSARRVSNSKGVKAPYSEAASRELKRPGKVTVFRASQKTEVHYDAEQPIPSVIPSQQTSPEALRGDSNEVADQSLTIERTFEAFCAMLEKADYQEIQDIWDHRETQLSSREEAAKLLSEMRFRVGISSVREPWDVLLNVTEIANFDINGEDGLIPREQEHRSTATQIPSRSSAVVNRFKRDSEVVRWTLDQALGTCECCNTKAPFERDDGVPYLEVHHLKMLSEGGSDSITNTVAVCPNCHRELHLGKQKGELLKMLYQKLSRLKIE